MKIQCKTYDLLTDRKTASFAHQINLHNILLEQFPAPSYCTGVLSKMTEQLFALLISTHINVAIACFEYTLTHDRDIEGASPINLALPHSEDIPQELES